MSEVKSQNISSITASIPPPVFIELKDDEKETDDTSRQQLKKGDCFYMLIWIRVCLFCSFLDTLHCCYPKACFTAIWGCLTLPCTCLALYLAPFTCGLF
jgi:hypothetical protein